MILSDADVWPSSRRHICHGSAPEPHLAPGIPQVFRRLSQIQHRRFELECPDNHKPESTLIADFPTNPHIECTANLDSQSPQSNPPNVVRPATDLFPMPFGC